jgi:hypothetical protein
MENQEIKPKKKLYKRWWFWVLMFFLFLFIISLTTPSKPVPPPSSPQQPENLPPPLKISALQLSEEYNANKVAADQKYEDKILEVSGTIDSIGKDILDTPYVTLKGREFSIFGVQCMFDKSQEDKLAKLVKDQSITITGKVSGELIGNIILRNCNF